MSDPKGASQTAVLISGYRARATESGEGICDDPWARALAGDSGEALCVQWDRHWPAMGLWVALRTRYIDDSVRGAIASGVAQVVILGAGLDTRAARLAADGVRFFEVDHPSSQGDKRHRLAALPNYPMSAATFVSCNFETDDFVERLASAGLDHAKPTCFVWEGVVYYLGEEAARSTLRRIASEFTPESGLVFDFLGRNLASSGSKLRDEDRAMQGMVADLGEPIRFGFNDATPLMNETGYRFVRTVNFDELALRYTGTYDRERYFRFQAIAVASASGEPPW